MKGFVFYIILALFVLSIQATIFPHVRPDLVLVLVCFYSLREGQMKGMAYGAVTGLLIDSASGFIIGPNILSKSVAGFLFSLIRQKFFFWNAPLNTLLIGLFSIIDIFIVKISLEIFMGMSFASRASGISIMVILYTTIAGLITYPVFKLREI